MPIRFTLAGWQMNLMMRERTLDRIENELVSGITRAVTRPPRSTAPQTAVLPTGPGRGPRGAPSNKFCGAYFQILIHKRIDCCRHSTTTVSQLAVTEALAPPLSLKTPLPQDLPSSFSPVIATQAYD